MINLNLTYTKAQTEIFFESQEKYVIVTKGRRLGATRGAAQAVIEWLLDGISPILWTETINGNVDRYYERYFLPVLKKLPENIEWNFNRQKRELNIMGHICDFRSADNPEHIEGFGYKKIFLNEAGIILKNDYLYTNALLPMMLDYPDSQLIAAGVPKGQVLRNGQEHRFYTLYKQAKLNRDGKYKLLEYTSYDNPFLRKEDIKALEDEFMMLGPNAYEQEIGGKFVEISPGQNPWMVSYLPSKHESTDAIYNPFRQVLISFDFNYDPLTAVFAHMWRDSEGEHFHIFDELELPNGSIPLLIESVIKMQSKYPTLLRSPIITGDAMGRKGELSQRDNASYYIQLKRGLNLRDGNFKVLPNPKHRNSRADCNYILSHFPDFKINPETCKNTCRDMKIVQCDGQGGIIKQNRMLEDQRADFLDNVRYLFNTFLSRWVRIDSKNRKYIQQ